MRPLSILWPVVLAGCTSLTPIDPYVQQKYQESVSSPERSAEAVARDVYRKPAEVLAFSGVKPGDTVIEVAPGAGYYTALLSRVVGPDGLIIAVDPERLFEVFERGRLGFPAYIESDPRQNVRYSTQYLDRIEIPPEQQGRVDQVWMVLYYHDTLWTGEDRQKMNQDFFNALKSGGRYLVIDHHAVAGAGPGVGQELHRMERTVALEEITAAGFRLVTESDLLQDAEDPRDDSVFAEHRRGRTDRFMLLFEKP